MSIVVQSEQNVVVGEIGREEVTQFLRGQEIVENR